MTTFVHELVSHSVQRSPKIIANIPTILLKKHKALVDGLALILELGRHLAADIYVSRTVDTKLSRGTNDLVCDSGLHHHLGNSGHVIRQNYPVAIGNKLKGNAQELVNIVGPLYTPLYVLADKVMLPKSSMGDYVVIFQSGAYGTSVSPKNFLSRPHVSEL
jgi:diaminopimelate decarboxylase